MQSSPILVLLPCIPIVAPRITPLDIYSTTVFQITHLDLEFGFPKKVEFPIHNDSKNKFLLVGSCDGLLCMKNDVVTGNLYPITYLWNPTIRKLKKLPDTCHHDFGHDEIERAYYMSSLGFDRQTNDYKVLHICRLELRER